MANVHYRQAISRAYNDTLKALQVVIQAGTAIIGKVRLIDSSETEVTETTNHSVKATLQAGTAIIGKVINPIIEKVNHPFGKGLLTTAGVQYSAEHTTTTDDYEAVETITFYNPSGYSLEELEFGLTMAIKSSGATESVLWKWQGSDNGTDWQDLIAAQTRAADAAAYSDVTISGRFAPTGNLLGGGATFQIRAVIKSGGAGGETATGKAKCSSYIYAHYRSS